MPESTPSDYAPLAEVLRSGFREGVHFGTAVGLSADGSVGYARGPIEAAMLPRSCAKPLQALACLRAGAPISGARLAIAAGSHSGQEMHLACTAGILADSGLGVDALRCPSDWPLDPKVRADLIRSGGEPARILMNCSGKHAAMLAACVARGWPTDSYLTPTHPLQELVRATTEELAGEKVAHTAVDGCGAPLLALSLTGLARAVQALLRSPAGSPENTVLTAMRSFPEYVAGEGRTDTRLMRDLPGAVAKEGAEGVGVIAAATGETVAVKISDGDAEHRCRTMAALSALNELGADTGPVTDLMSHPLLGGGRTVGEVRPI